MGKKSCQIIALLFYLCHASCVKDKPSISAGYNHVDSGSVYIICEGSYGSGNGSLYAYEPLKDSVFGDLFKSVNHVPLGDVFQSMTKIGGYFYLAINNSNKVTIIDAHTYRYISSIGIYQPRYILNTGNDKAYVSSLYNNKMYVINTKSLTVIDSVLLPSKSAEGMCICNGAIASCTWDTADNHIYVIDVSTNKVVQSIRVAGYAPQEVLVDKNQLLWVLSGNQPEGKPATLTHIDISSGIILDSFMFPATVNPVKPVFNNAKDTLYFIEADYYGNTSNNGVFRMSIYDKSLPASPFVAAQQYQYFWALGINPNDGNIYVGDPKGFVQKGAVRVYSSSGGLLKNFNVGLGPGHFYFD